LLGLFSTSALPRILFQEILVSGKYHWLGQVKVGKGNQPKRATKSVF
jgi:hypothetical protein